MYKVETIAYRGHDIEIYQDEFVDSPSDWNDNMVGWHREFTVENKHINRNIFGYILGLQKKDKDLQEEFLEYKDEAKDLLKKYHVFGLDAYIHSGIALHLHGEGYRDRWDTSDYVGAVIVEKKEAKTRKQAYKIASGIVETWNDYLSGNVYGYSVDIGAGCGGYYGDYEKSGLLDDAKSEIDGYIKDTIAKHTKTRKAQIVNHVPLEKREPLTF